MAKTPGRYTANHTPCRRTRREFLWQVGGGFAGLALIDLLTRDGFFSRLSASEAPAHPLAPRPSHYATRAKHAIFLFMNGAPSHVNTFDYKPALSRFQGTAYQGNTPVGSNGRPIGRLMQSPFEFKKHGQSGLQISSPVCRRPVCDPFWTQRLHQQPQTARGRDRPARCWPDDVTSS